jgi:hypothetical protein
VLFSDERVREVLNNQVIASWEMVREVPKVTIDFGDGRVLERTLKGNTVIYLCKPDGTVIDAYPGIYTPDDFLRELQKGLDILHSSPGAALAEWHKAKIGELATNEFKRSALSKAVVETPLLNALGLRGKNGFRETMWEEGAEIWRSDDARIQWDNTPESMRQAFQKLAQRLEDLSDQPMNGQKARREVVGTQGASLSPEEAGKQAIAADSRANVQIVRPAVHLLLATYAQQSPTPGNLREPLFKQLLHIDIDDPYLGLAHTLLPGTPGH